MMSGAVDQQRACDGTEERLRELLATAALFRWLARGMMYPYPGARGTLLAEARQLLLLLPAWSRMQDALSNTDEGLLEAEYCRLFMGRGVCSLHETAYGDGQRMGGQVVELADISGFYRAFGVEPSPTQPDLPDHLCSELEFYSLLLIKEAYALDEAWTEQAQVAEEAGQTFLSHHLGRWIVPLAEGVRDHAGADTFYGTLATVLQEVVAQECRRRGVTPQPFSGRLTPDEGLQGDAFICPREQVPSAN
ncbi:MAG: molecular chaperone TorD family protein [Magnetococcales bacterium]|nr:molecular chaperone TorD family protein [Magnetococcales bacterium]